VMDPKDPDSAASEITERLWWRHAEHERLEGPYTRVDQCLGKVRSRPDDGEVFVGARTGIYAREAETACER
jgi:hypothetical protein